MRKLIQIEWDKPQPLRARIGNSVNAWLFGSVAKGTSHEGSDIDVYVSGPRAMEVERKYAFQRPPVYHNGQVYSLHVSGPLTICLETFLATTLEAKQLF